MAVTKKRVFIAFAAEDRGYRDLLVGQAKNNQSPFDFQDFSVKEPWDEKWKTNCRTKVKGCEGLIALISKHTLKASGQLWEIHCADEESVPTMLMWVNDERPALPSSLSTRRINVWTWNNVKNFIEKL